MEVEISCEIKEASGNPKESFKKGVMSLVVLVSKCINPSFHSLKEEVLVILLTQLHDKVRHPSSTCAIQ
ncbi:hypothetical protein YC2023_035510 [Brassica napus]